jgi:CRISPR type III-A-associated protein Csm2
MKKHKKWKSDKPSAPHPGKLNVKWITEKDAIDNKAVAWAERAGEYLKDKNLTPSSLRRFFGEVRRIESDFARFSNDVPLLRARLAYDAGRKGGGVKAFSDLVKDGIIAINKDPNRFNRFIKIIEAIVAFHKAADGGEKI